ncbi:MAG: hypothetical protein AAF587_21255 [Bacteroidota bacterium]
MKQIYMLSLLLSICSSSLLAQTSSQPTGLQLKGEWGLRGRWQTGNLSQIGINPYGRLTLMHPTYRSEWQVSYQYMNVSGFTVISDLWANGFHAISPQKRLHPLLAIYTGFAKSYKITESLVTGAGAELNLYQQSPMNFVRAHLFGGYMHVQFEQESPHTALAVGTGIRSAFPLGKRIQLLWDFDTYHSTKETAFWGANNRLVLLYPLFKGLSLNLSHTIIFNNKTFPDLKKTNSLMQFGIQITHFSSKS